MVDSDNDDFQDSSPTGTDTNASSFDFPEVPTDTEDSPPIIGSTNNARTSTTGTQDAAQELLKILRGAPSVPPTKPKIGGIVSRAGKQVAWTGGQPLVDWSALDPNAKQYPATPTQLAPLEVD